MKKYLTKISYLSTAAIVLVSALVIGLPGHAKADYNPSLLISDPIFTDTGSMSQSDIQNFLVSKNSGLQGYKDTENCGSTGGAHYSYYATYYSCGQYVLASQIIYNAAQAYQISPRVILATMQKEQSLVTTPNPTQSQLNCAMGYLSCSSSYTGFFNQVDNGTWQMRYDFEGTLHASSWNGWTNINAGYASICGNPSSLYSAGLYPGNTVTFYDPGGTAETVTLGSSGTAVLYCYTPYVGPYSQTGYSGSYNFVISFDAWWGSTTNVCGSDSPPANPKPHNADIQGDYTGSGVSDPTVYDPSTGCWHVRGVGDFQYGNTGDIPVPGNYTNSGVTEAAVYRPSDGTWHIRGVGDFPTYGQTGDIPVPGDYTGNGITDMAVYRPSDGTWHVRGVGDFPTYGQTGDIPVPGDYTGDGITNIAVYRPGDGTWHIRGVGDFQYGEPGDIPVPGDYTGNGVTDAAVYRPSDGTWHIRGVGDFQYGGVTGDVPVPGEYAGGVTEQMAIYRPGEGGWHISAVGDFPYGTSTDIPLVQPLNAYWLYQYGLISGY